MLLTARCRFRSFRVEFCSRSWRRSIAQAFVTGTILGLVFWDLGTCGSEMSTADGSSISSDCTPTLTSDACVDCGIDVTMLIVMQFVLLILSLNNMNQLPVHATKAHSIARTDCANGLKVNTFVVSNLLVMLTMAIPSAVVLIMLLYGLSGAMFSFRQTFFATGVLVINDLTWRMYALVATLLSRWCCT